MDGHVSPPINHIIDMLRRCLTSFVPFLSLRSEIITFCSSRSICKKRVHDYVGLELHQVVIALSRT